MGRIKFRVIPKSSHTEFAGEYADALKVKLSSPPIDGRANAELVKFLSKKLDVPKSAISIVSGDTARDKTLEIEGMDRARALELLSK